MQPRGWELTRASRIVIILLVVQYLGLGPILALAPGATAPSDPADPSQTAVLPDAVLPLAVAIPADLRASTALARTGSRTIAPDPLPLPRLLPRAPPAS
jgi:hypothetical protein